MKRPQLTVGHAKVWKAVFTLFSTLLVAWIFLKQKGLHPRVNHMLERRWFMAFMVLVIGFAMFVGSWGLGKTADVVHKKVLSPCAEKYSFFYWALWGAALGILVAAILRWVCLRKKVPVNVHR